MKSESLTALWLQRGSYTVSYRLRADIGWSGSIELGLETQPLKVVSTPIGNNATGYNFHFSIETEANSTVLLQPILENAPLSGVYQTLSYSFHADGLSIVKVDAQIGATNSSAYLDQVTITQDSL